MQTSPHSSVRVWDMPTRLFHWLLALTVIGSFVTVKLGGNWMVWHARLGFVALALVSFRIVWGFVGGRYARFSSFLFGPGAILAYLRGTPDAPRTPGHNPLGSLSVFGLLAVVAFQSVSGLFANDEIAFEGPLARFVSSGLSATLTTWHRRDQVLILLLVALHVGAIVFYRFARHENLVRPMLTGDKDVAGGAPPSRDDGPLRLRALLVATACAAIVAWIVNR